MVLITLHVKQKDHAWQGFSQRSLRKGIKQQDLLLIGFTKIQEKKKKMTLVKKLITFIKKQKQYDI